MGLAIEVLEWDLMQISSMISTMAQSQQELEKQCFVVHKDALSIC
jgi:hypothetical protein